MLGKSNKSTFLLSKSDAGVLNSVNQLATVSKDSLLPAVVVVVVVVLPVMVVVVVVVLAKTIVGDPGPLRGHKGEKDLYSEAGSRGTIRQCHGASCIGKTTIGERNGRSKSKHQSDNENRPCWKQEKLGANADAFSYV